MVHLKVRIENDYLHLHMRAGIRLMLLSVSSAWHLV